MKINLRYLAFAPLFFVVACTDTNGENSSAQLRNGTYSQYGPDKCDSMLIGAKFSERALSMIVAGETRAIRNLKVYEEEENNTVRLSGDLRNDNTHPNVQNFDIEFTVTPLSDNEISVSDFSALISLKSGDERTMFDKGPEIWRRCAQV